jgi:hypothetical protein
MEGLPHGYIALAFDQVLVDSPKYKSILFDFGDAEEWIPRNQIDDMFEDDHPTVVLTEWIAKKKGLI